MKTSTLFVVLAALAAAQPAAAQKPPRRALVISVHDYLYANPVSAGDAQLGHVRGFVEKLSRGAWQIPAEQVLHLSDEAVKPTLPTQAVIQATLSHFLDTSRTQEQIVVVFVGHAVELADKAYFVPGDGELDSERKLIPLQWLYVQLAKCKAEQKTLILDVCRQEPARGQLRPVPEQVRKELFTAIDKPPPGVQVWLACGSGGVSHEGEEIGEPGGLFLRALGERLDRAEPLGRWLPVEEWADDVNRRLEKRLTPLRRAQQSVVLGKANRKEATPEARAAVPPRVEGAHVENKERLEVIRAVLREASMPDLRPAAQPLTDLLAEVAFTPAEIDKVAKGLPPARLKNAVDRARFILWTASGEKPPRDLAVAVQAARQKEGGAVLLPFEFRAAPLGAEGERVFKAALLEQARDLATMLRLLEEVLGELREAAEERAQAPRRWQAHYDYVLARTLMQTAFVYEYSSLLGQMRREVPELDEKLHSGWVPASQPRLTGDVTGRKLAREAHKLLDAVLADYRGTPWEALARRARLTNLGLEWRARR